MSATVVVFAPQPSMHLVDTYGNTNSCTLVSPYPEGEAELLWGFYRADCPVPAAAVGGAMTPGVVLGDLVVEGLDSEATVLKSVTVKEPALPRGATPAPVGYQPLPPAFQIEYADGSLTVEIGKFTSKPSDRGIVVSAPVSVTNGGTPLETHFDVVQGMPLVGVANGGLLGGAVPSSLGLARWAPGESRTGSFEAAFPASAGRLEDLYIVLDQAALLGEADSSNMVIPAAFSGCARESHGSSSGCRGFVVHLDSV